MSYWVYLRDAQTGDVVEVDKHAEGGTYVLGGTTRAELNVTYNYWCQFAWAWQDAGGSFDGEGTSGLGDMLGEKVAIDVLPTIAKAVGLLGTLRHDDYWKPTPGNAGYALSILGAWAVQHPDAVFEVS